MLPFLFINSSIGILTLSLLESYQSLPVAYLVVNHDKKIPAYAKSAKSWSFDILALTEAKLNTQYHIALYVNECLLDEFLLVVNNEPYMVASTLPHCQTQFCVPCETPLPPSMACETHDPCHAVMELIVQRHNPLTGYGL